MKNNNLVSYPNYLLEQYKHAKGIDDISFDDLMYLILISGDFDAWLEDMNESKKAYLALLNYMHIEIENGNVAEVNKSGYDSIVKDNGKTRIITPYTYGFEDSKNPKTFEKFEISDNADIFLGKRRLPRKNRFVDRVIFQNPTSLETIKNFDKLHLSGRDVTFGIYGNRLDKGTSLKLKMVEVMKSLLPCDTYNSSYYDDGKYYAFAISSKGLLK